jgi:hypothetical protein
MRRGFPAPEYLEVRGELSLSVHNVLSHLKGSNPWALLLSESRQGRHFIKQVSFVPNSAIPLPQGLSSFPSHYQGQREVLEPFFQPSDFKMSAFDLYNLIGKTARELLTGHILALRYLPFLRKVNPKTRADIDGSPTWDFKFNSVATETTLTQYTAESYRLLTEWLESSPAQVLAAVEGVSVVTIRNRLHSAREQGLLDKPGSGKRGLPKL